MKFDLSRLLRPNSVAVFGGNWAENVIQQCLKFSFEGEIWPVHPYKTEILGLKCYEDVSHLPGPPDASFIGINRNQTPLIIGQLSKIGAGGAVCFASGFAETKIDDTKNTGENLQRELITMAGDMPFLGPNCYGMINYLDGALLWPDQHGGRKVSKGVAIITQSSNIAINISMQARGLPLSYIITAGNQAQISQSEIALGLLDDERVTAIGLHVEGIDNPKIFEKLAKKAIKKKVGIIAIKVGKSEAAQAATVSHTASLAGNDSAANALFERLGIARVDDLETFLNSLIILHQGGPLFGNSISSMSCSGGEASLVADLAEELDLHFPSFDEETKDELSDILGPLVHISNPLDYQTYIWHDREKLALCFSAVLECNHDLTFLIMDFPRQDICSDTAWEPAIEAIIKAKTRKGSRVAILASLDENLPEEKALRFHEAGIIPVSGIKSSLKAAAAVIKVGNSWKNPLSEELLWNNWSQGPILSQSEYDSKLFLQTLGIDTPKFEIVKTKSEILKGYEKFVGPVVLKGLGHAHKSEYQALALDICSSEQLVEAFESINKAKGAPLGFIIEEFIQDGLVEILIGFMRDPNHGFLLTIGEGGTLSEIRNDTQNLLLPVNEGMIMKALRNLKIWPVLQGYRGKAKIDLDSILNTIIRIQKYIMKNPDEIIEMEINPLIITRDRGIAADALITKQKI